jgi:hypothetical protein
LNYLIELEYLKNGPNGHWILDLEFWTLVALVASTTAVKERRITNFTLVTFFFTRWRRMFFSTTKKNKNKLLLSLFSV